MMQGRLPLFPLQVVLFPHAALPLHIFEERYKILIQESVDRSEEFGIVLIADQVLAEVGCSAAVTSVVATYEDGQRDIIVEGRKRFRVADVDEHTAPYLVGSVLFLEEPRSCADPALARETIQLYNELVRVVYGSRVRQLAEDLAEPGVAFVMAQKAGLDLQERQRLLELETEEDRLTMLRFHLQKTIPKLQKMEQVEQIIRSDGYIS